MMLQKFSNIKFHKIVSVKHVDEDHRGTKNIISTHKKNPRLSRRVLSSWKAKVGSERKARKLDGL